MRLQVFFPPGDLDLHRLSPPQLAGIHWLARCFLQHHEADDTLVWSETSHHSCFCSSVVHNQLPAEQTTFPSASAVRVFLLAWNYIFTSWSLRQHRQSGFTDSDAAVGKWWVTVSSRQPDFSQWHLLDLLRYRSSSFITARHLLLQYNYTQQACGSTSRTNQTRSEKVLLLYSV